MTYVELCRVFGKRTLLFLLATILIFISPLHIAAQDFHSTILSQDQNHIRIKYSFDKPKLDIVDGKSYAFYEKSVDVINQNGAKVPAITQLISLAGKKADVKIISNTQHTVKVDNYLVTDEQPPTGLNPVNIKYIGILRGVSVFSLSILPVNYNTSTKELIWNEELVIEISNQSPVKEREIFQPKKIVKENYNYNFVEGTQLYQSDAIQDVSEINVNNPIALNYSVIYKVRINKTGLYKITYDDLANNNFPVDNINPKYLSLYNKGIEIPIYLSGSDDNRFDLNDFFEFWAEKNEKTFYKDYDDEYTDPFSDDNIYWLVEGDKPGSRMVEESGSISETNPSKYIIPFRFTEKLHFENDTHWERFGYNPEFIDDVAYKYDHWYWGNILTAVSSRSYEFQLSHPYKQGANVFVTAMFRGVSIPNSSTNQITGHQVAVWLNDEKVGEILPAAQWLGQTKEKITNSVALSQSNLINGTNSLRVTLDQEGVTDIVLFNWFDIQYYRKYRASNNMLKFKLQDDLFSEDKVMQFEIDGFTNNNIHIYKLGLSKIVNGRVDIYRDTDDNFTSNRITIQDKVYDPDVEYIAITDDAKLKPKAIEEYFPWKENLPSQSLLDKSNSADLIIVTHKIFLDQALRLKSLKEQAGFTVEVATVDQIYDAFNNGIKSPLAIKKFLQYAYFNWNQAKKLRYVILAGDASYDYKNLISSKTDFVPTIMFSTNGYGAAPSDLQFACIFGNDLIPDIAIGRIPASTATEFSDYIDKIEEYQNNTDFSSWRNRALFISGNDESDKEIYTQLPVFRTQNNRILNIKVPQHIFGYRLNVIKDKVLGDDDPDFGGNRDLLDYFDDGLTFVNFFGHGGGAIWSDKDLLSLDGVDDLNNSGKYPFVSSMTCFTGAFENFSKEGLAEKLVMVGGKGAIATLASSSVGWTYNDFAIQWPLHDFLWQDDMSFGEAVDNMKIAYMANSIYYTENASQITPGYYWNRTAPLWSSIVNQYNLLGDPTLHLQKPNGQLELSISNQTPGAGETITIKINAPQNSGIGMVEISDQNNYKYFTQNFALNAGAFSFDFNVPSLEDDSLIVGRLFKVKTYVYDNSIGAAGNSSFVVEGSLIKSVKITPGAPQVNEKVAFEIVAKSHSPIAHIELRKFRKDNSTSEGQVTIVMSQINDSLFHSVTSHQGFAEAGTYFYEIYVRDAAGKETKYDLNKIIVNDLRPDLVLNKKSIQYAGVDQLQVKFSVYNNSTVPVDSVELQAFLVSDTIPFFDTQYTFSARETKTFYAPFYTDSVKKSQKFKVVVDPENHIVERDETNNIAPDAEIITDHILVTRALGSTTDGINNNNVDVLDKWGFFVRKNNIANTTVVGFADSNITSNVALGEQKGFKYSPFKSSNDTTALYIKFENPAANPVATIFTYLDSTQKMLEPSFYILDPFLGLWSRIETDDSVTINGKVSAEIKQNGLYAVFSSDDKSDPFIEITANGRPLRNDGLVKSNPSIGFLLQDENGIDYKNTFRVLINDEPISPDQLIIPDSINSANSIAIQATPHFEDGIHTIDVYVADLNKNESSVHRTFNVSGDKDFMVYGNFPNPFETSTIISFTNLFNNNLSKLTTKIYSVSGHLVRSKKLEGPDGEIDYDPTATGYGELVWDGTDDDGNEVANGVYFVIMRAEFIDSSNKKSSFKKILKVAKLK